MKRDILRWFAIGCAIGAFITAVLVVFAVAKARADVGGQQVSPGNCPYPAVGPFGFDGVAEHYACDFPTEINGSHHRCLFGGAATSVVAGVSLFVFNAGVVQPVGVLEGQCYWACPDGSMAEEPNPVGTWQGSSTATTPVKRTPCKSIAVNPFTPN